MLKFNIHTLQWGCAFDEKNCSFQHGFEVEKAASLNSAVWIPMKQNSDAIQCQKRARFAALSFDATTGVRWLCAEN